MPRLQRRAPRRDLGVVERVRHAADVWPCSWPLPAISSTSPAASAATRRARSPRRGRRSRAAPGGRRRRIAARIAAGSSLRGLSSVTMARSARRGGDLAHHRPLAAVAVAAAAEHHDQPAARRAAAARAARSPARRACGRNRHRPARRCGGAPTSCSRPGAPLSVSRAATARADVAAGRQRRGRARPARCEAWKRAGQRQLDVVPRAQRLRASGAGRAGAARRVEQPQIAAACADRSSSRMPRAARRSRASGRSRSLSALSTAVRAGRQQLVEQPQLGREVGLHRAVIVEMVVRQVGEAAGGELHAVEPVLVEAVARRLDREIGRRPRAASSASVRCSVDRVGRGERRSARGPGPTDAERAEARGLAAEPASRSGGRTRRSRSCRWCR